MLVRGCVGAAWRLETEADDLLLLHSLGTTAALHVLAMHVALEACAG